MRGPFNRLAPIDVVLMTVFVADLIVGMLWLLHRNWFEAGFALFIAIGCGCELVTRRRSRRSIA